MEDVELGRVFHKCKLEVIMASKRLVVGKIHWFVVRSINSLYHDLIIDKGK